jgi:phosphoglycolate phosphatase-like HAD superfamily hydrolase
VTAVAVDLDVLGDAGSLWRAWLEDASRRYRVDGLERFADAPGGAEDELDARLGNWRPLLERFAEDNAGAHLRPTAEVNAALRRLQAAGVRVGAFTDRPEPLARVAAAQLAVARRLEALEAGSGSLARLLERLGPGVETITTLAELETVSASPESEARQRRL